MNEVLQARQGLGQLVPAVGQSAARVSSVGEIQKARVSRWCQGRSSLPQPMESMLPNFTFLKAKVVLLTVHVAEAQRAGSPLAAPSGLDRHGFEPLRPGVTFCSVMGCV